MPNKNFFERAVDKVLENPENQAKILVYGQYLVLGMIILGYLIMAYLLFVR
ncbi:hypothetical protein [Methanocella arvoryzae]|uniref:hypothetical protein n=1 Tax=Methanocella arvoryzae TaxID=1175445 RepID=UPI00032376D2|nr:hypothetical protein [Methanocella arvoryzae]